MSLVGLYVEVTREIELSFHTIKIGNIGVVSRESPNIIKVEFPFSKAGVNLFVGEWEVIVPTVTKEELDQLL